MLNNPSDEQLTIINQVMTHNIIVDAVAGSGKTTTILHMALKYPKFNILVLTYNSKLRLETLNRIKELNLQNIQVQTYHGFCVKYYDSNCKTDNQINNILRNNTTMRKKIKFDLLIIDEAQDVTPTYYELICKIIKDNNGVQHICILGDKNQSIFNFNKADTRFITLADKLFDFNALSWIKCDLNTSYRLTSQMGQFMNECILQENRIITQKRGSRVRYYVCNTFDDYDRDCDYIPFDEVKRYLVNYTNDDIFILGPSVKCTQSPIRKLANKLTEQKIPIFVPNNDDEKIDEDVIKGKIVFSTFHQVKGLERKVVLVFGVTDKYFTFFDKQGNPNKCPNTIYVALTRAKECLTLFHHYKDNYCNFIDPTKLRLHTKFFEDPIYKLEKKNNNSNSNKIKTLGVTELLKHLSFEVIEHAKSYLKITEFQKQTTKINIETKTKQGKYFENVSEITGTAIPAHFEYINKGDMEIRKELEHQSRGKRNYQLPTSTSELLKLANEYCAFRSGYDYKLSQINDYTWLNDDQLKLAVDRLSNHISKNATFEKEFEHENQILLKNKKKLIGVIDCIDNNKVWEFKCVNRLDNDHILQLGIYAYLLYEDNNKKRGQLIENIKKKYDGMTYDFIEHTDVTFKSRDNILCGTVTKVFKNGNINIRSNNKIYKVPRGNIIKINIIDDMIKNIDELEKKYEFYLFNTLDNQILKIEAEYENLKAMVDYLIFNKYGAQEIISNENFINKINMIKNKYLKDGQNPHNQWFDNDNFSEFDEMNEEENEKVIKKFQFDDESDDEYVYENEQIL